MIHYKDKSSYSPLKDVNELNKDRIRQAKNEHEKQPPSSNKHFEQCKSIPKTIDNNVHLVFCLTSQKASQKVEGVVIARQLGHHQI